MSPRAVLVGLPGSGKTTIGKRLANALNLQLVDTDHMLEEKLGKTCNQIMGELGEPGFREQEAIVVAEALQSDGIVSLGGGAVVTESTRDLLADQTVVYLNVSIDEGVRRTSGSNTRPLLNVADPRSKYAQLFAQRSAYYEEVSNFMVRCDGKEPRRVVTDILMFIEEVRLERLNDRDASHPTRTR